VAAAPACFLTRPLRNSFVLEKKELLKATHETTNHHRLPQNLIRDYSFPKHLLALLTTFPRACPRHWPQSPRTTPQIPHPSLHCPRTSTSNPHAVIPHPTSQRHLLILESADPAGSPVCLITSPWTDSSLLSSRYPKFCGQTSAVLWKGLVSVKDHFATPSLVCVWKVAL